MKYILLLTVLVSTLFSSAVGPSDKIDPANFDHSLFEKVLIQKINAYRKSKGVRPLMSNTIIKKVAADHNNYLKTKKEITHSQTIAGKETLKDRFLHYLKVPKYALAENLARTFVLKPTYNYDRSGKTSLTTAKTYTSAAEYMLNAWIQSPIHNENLIDANYQLSGIATYFNPVNFSLTAVQVFAKIG